MFFMGYISMGYSSDSVSSSSEDTIKPLNTGVGNSSKCKTGRIAD